MTTTARTAPVVLALGMLLGATAAGQSWTTARAAMIPEGEVVPPYVTWRRLDRFGDDAARLAVDGSRHAVVIASPTGHVRRVSLETGAREGLPVLGEMQPLAIAAHDGAVVLVTDAGAMRWTTGDESWSPIASGDAELAALNDRGDRLMTASERCFTEFVLNGTDVVKAIRHDDLAGDATAVTLASGRSLVATIDEETPAVILEAHDGKLDGLPVTHAGEIIALAVSPDGKLWATGSQDRTVTVGAFGASDAPLVLAGHAGWVSALAFSGDGGTLATGGWDGNVLVWDVGQGSTTPMRLRPPVRSSVSSVAMTRDGRSVVVGMADGTVWERAVNEPSEVVFGVRHEGPLYSAAIDARGRFAVTVSTDHQAIVWDLNTRGANRVLQGHRGAVTSVALTLDGQTIVTGSSDGRARVFTGGDRVGLELTVPTGKAVNAVAISPDGGRVAVGDRASQIHVFDLPLGRHLTSLRGHRDFIKSLTFSRDGSALASTSDDDHVIVWREGERPVVLAGHGASAHWASFSPDGESLVSGSLDRTLRFWNTRTGKAGRVVKGFDKGVNTVQFTPDGSQVLVSGSDGVATMVDTATGARLRDVPAHELACVWAGTDGSGALLATASTDGTLRVEMPGGRTRTFPEAPAGNTAMAANEGNIVTGSADGTIRVWRRDRPVLVRSTNLTAPVIGLRAGGGTFFAATASGVYRLDAEAVVAVVEGLELASFDVAADGKHVVVVTKTGQAIECAADGGHQSLLAEDVRVAVLGPDGDRVAVVGARGIEVSKLHGGQTIRRIPVPQTGATVARWIAATLVVGDDLGRVVVWSLDPMARRGSAWPHDGPVTAMTIHGKHVLTASDDGQIKVLSLETRDIEGVLTGHTGSVTALSSADGKVMAAGADGWWTEWMVTEQRVVARGRTYEDGGWAAHRADRLYRSTNGHRIKVRRRIDGALVPLSLPEGTVAVKARVEGTGAERSVIIENTGETLLDCVGLTSFEKSAATLITHGHATAVPPGTSVTIPISVWWAPDEKAPATITVMVNGREAARVSTPR